MIFGSDNWAGAAPQISEGLMRHAQGLVQAYGESELDQAITRQFSEIFETDCDVVYVGTGTAANSLAFASVMQPGGVAFCHSEAHLFANEGGAPEFAAGGGRLCLVDGDNAKINPAALEKEVVRFPKHFNHFGQGVIVSITQSTEGGTVYTLDELDEICAVSKQAGLPVHMDGARFANAMVHLNCSPAEMTWKRGVDMVSFGATKNGCWCAEALVVFNDKLKTNIRFLRKRMGHLFSKSRFISAQFEAYFENDTWLELASYSNSIGNALAEMVSASNRVRLAWPSPTNQVFFIADKADANHWLEKGAKFHPFPSPRSIADQVQKNEQVYRLVAGFASTQQDVEDLGNIFKSIE